MSRRVLAALLASLVLAGAALTSTGQAAFAGNPLSTNKIQRLTNLKPMYDVGVKPGTAPAASPAATGLASWSQTVSDGGSSFTYRMVGKNPFVHQATPSTTVSTPLVPVIIRFTDGSSWNPTAGDSCDTTSAVTRTMNSPMVKSRSWKFGGTAAGTGQYSDAFQRANFFTQTKSTGINPGYHVKLNYVVQPAITINVPPAASAEGTITCGNGKLGAVEINWLDNYLQTVALPQLAARGFGPKTLPLFLLGNVVEFITTTSNCCVLGYHNATSTSPSAQTYSVSMYDNTGAFSGSGNVSVLSHEVAEWINDPFVNNPTKPWGHIGQVSGCQNNLEVGDPLSGTTTTVTMNGKAYLLQENAFVSWFYHQKPSTGINGWYSNLGKFRSPALACA
ncbi:MAG: hypothetical protein ABI890_11265 [Lapillicoccus sp.]